jgi:hypothetical protein
MFGGRSAGPVIATADLPGAPIIDPVAMLPITRRVAGLGDKAELISLRACVGESGLTNFRERSVAEDGALMLAVFASGASVAGVRVDQDGVRAPDLRERGAVAQCGACGCDVAAPPPICTVARVVEGAQKVGLERGTQAVVTYSFCQSEGPRWVVAVPGRGEVRISDATCSPLVGESLPAPPRPMNTLPGAPNAVDPFALLADARQQAGLSKDAVLVSFDAWFATKKGQIDLQAESHRGRAEYVFADPSGEHVRWVVVDEKGMRVEPGRAKTGAFSDLRVKGDGGASAAILAPPPPRCTPERLWRATMPEAPASSLAHINYEADPKRPTRGLWTIELSPAAQETRSDVVCSAYD